MSARKMGMVAFMQASEVSVYPGSWRYPSTDRDFLSLDHYIRAARTLERGLFDMLFFDDRLTVPNIYKGSHAPAVEYGASSVKMDPVTILGGIAAATSHIGLGATYSTTYYPPYHIARVFATLDHMSNGRAAWNIVTSLNDGEAQNFGVEQTLGHDERYDRADELMEAVTALWDSWEEGAVLQDLETGRFADPDKVHEVNYDGKWFRTRGPLSVPRTPQGRPLLMQAGSSGRGRDFAARWADTVFFNAATVEAGKEHRHDQRERAAAMGKNPDDLKMFQMAYVIVGETEEIAKAKEKLFLGDGNYIHPEASAALISEGLNYDFGQHDLDEIITDEVAAGMGGTHGLVTAVRKMLGREISFRNLAEFRSTSLRPRFVGTGRQVAEAMTEWFETGACDGFVLAATHRPGTAEDFVRMVVPELQKLDVYRTSYEGDTLRENLGLPSI